LLSYAFTTTKVGQKERRRGRKTSWTKAGKRKKRKSRSNSMDLNKFVAEEQKSSKGKGERDVGTAE